MAFKLTKPQIEERQKLAADLRAKATTLAAAISHYNEAMAEFGKTVTEAATAYNESIETARDFVTEIANAARTELDEKSEQWQETERGIAAGEWVQEWECVDLEETALDDTMPIETIDPGEVAGVLEDLPG